MDEELKKEIEMHRSLMNVKCRDYHGVILKDNIRDYIIKYCAHYPKHIRIGLEQHAQYDSTRDKTRKDVSKTGNLETSFLLQPLP